MTVAPLGNARVAGQSCSAGAATWVYEVIVDSLPWPWKTRAPCNHTGVPVQLCIDADGSLCTDEFVFTGDDVTVDMEWSELEGFPDPPTISANFVHEAQPQLVTLLNWSFHTANTSCGGGQTTPVVLSSVTRWWPLSTHEGCADPPLDIVGRFETEELGELEGAFTWNGGDIVLEVETGVSLSTPTPSPFPQNNIVVRFVEGPDAQPVDILLDGEITRLLADNVDCTPDHASGEVSTSEYSLLWPLQGTGLPPECTKGPPTTLRFEFTNGRVFTPGPMVEGTWTGSDLEVLYETSGELASSTATPSASVVSGSPTPAPSIAKLPAAGGTVEASPQNRATQVHFVLGLICLLLVIASAVAASNAIRR
jgi:hypothetical protein